MQDISGSKIAYLGWTYPDYEVYVATPVTLVDKVLALLRQIMILDLQQGIDGSLDAKVDLALRILSDVNVSNNGAAANALNAFINEVEAQRGQSISGGDADALIAKAQTIIDLLD